MLLIAWYLSTTVAHAGRGFPANYPADDPVMITETMRQYLQEVPVNVTPDSPEVREHGAALGLVRGLAANHAQLSLPAQRAALFAIGALFLRAIINRSSTGGVIEYHGTKRQRELERLLGDATATLIGRIAEGDLLPDLRDEARQYRTEAIRTLRRAALTSPSDESLFVGLIERLQDPRLEEQIEGPDCLGEIALTAGR